MEEKHMVNDALESKKYEIILFTNAYLNSENMELKQIFTTIRSDCEIFHSELFTLAISKGYYTPNFISKP